MKTVAILQSNYIPWKGYFDLIAAVDEFILYDDMQYTKNDWRNRNKIKTPKGVEWLTVPSGQDISRRIRDVELPDARWQKKHWKTIEANYRRASGFEVVAEWLAPLYIDRTYSHLSELNRQFIESVCGFLSIDTKISNSWDYHLIDGKTEKLVGLCEQANATRYISGPSAKDYIDEQCFKEAGIELLWFDYDGYPEYQQLWGGFTHYVSIIDLLLNCGFESKQYMRYVKNHDSI